MIAIIFGSIFLVGVIALLVVAARGGAKLQNERRRKMESARPATAVVTQIEETGEGRDLALGEFRRYAVTLDVRDGQKRSTKTSVWNVKADATALATGAEVQVRIDALDDETVYPAFVGAGYEWLSVRRQEALNPGEVPSEPAV